MKNVVAKCLIVIMVLSVLVSGCGNKEKEKEEIKNSIPIENAEDVLLHAWMAYDEADKFSIVGGNLDNEMIGSMAEFALDQVDEMNDVLGIPKNVVAYIDNAASMKHETAAYTFTCGAFYIKDSKNINDFQEKVRENIKNKRWLEGEPEKLVIATVSENYVVVVFGLEDKVDTFRTYLKSATGAKIVANMYLE